MGLLALALLVGGCQPQSAAPASARAEPTLTATLPLPSPSPSSAPAATRALPTGTPAPQAPPPLTATAASAPPLSGDQWQALPVVPPISPAMRAVYQKGLAMGNNPAAFSKVGDCETTPTWFLGDFDRKADRFRLGPYGDLQPVVDQFAGSFGRTSLAARSGFNAASVFSPLWADPKQCKSGETPLACEYRLHQPAFAFIMLGTNDVYHLKTFEDSMRRIIEFSLDQGVVPVLATKADNMEGDNSVNLTIARLAQEYQIPLWNFWAAVQDLPDAGLQEDGVHLTWGPNFFDDADAMKSAWAHRNLTALQTLDAVWRAVAK
jgi:hypothetical protein